ncbi:N-acyl homoserine lactonase family protein [Marinicellulosiphila megalodicopiae]|uniref:N-acyl homoserine lactonase family protein n=1 Tax=Marinicellulosiphila megalodicopiae TaxID=2724896 RepID=UPI003BAF0316
MKSRLLHHSLFIKLSLILIGGMSFISNSQGAQSELTIQSTGKTPLKVYVLDCGQVKSQDMSVFNSSIKKGTVGHLANPCFLIQHQKGTLLWDTGVSEAIITQPNGIDVSGGAFNFSVTKTLTEQLKEINIEPKNINYLAFSHMHLDHTGNALLFSQANWLIQAQEFAIANSAYAKKYGYAPLDYQSTQSLNITELTGDFDVFDDGSVVIISTPGHSAGHQSLFIDLPKHGPIVLSGDLYHFESNREQYGIPSWNDKKATISSFAKIDRILDLTNSELWIQHDKKQFEKLTLSPNFYE